MARSWAGATPFSLPRTAWRSLQPNIGSCTAGNVDFTLVLHCALRHRTLHFVPAGKFLPETPIDELRGRKEHAVQIGHEAGATRHFAARCVTCSAGSLPPRIAGLRDEFCAACNDEF